MINRLKYIVLLNILCFSLTNHGAAQKCYQEDTLKKNIIKLNPWGIYWGSYSFLYERKFGVKNSLELMANFKYNTKNKFFLLQRDEELESMSSKANGFMVGLSYSFYPSNLNHSEKKISKYVSPFLKYSYLKFESNANDFIYSFNMNSFKAGAVLGIQKILRNIAIDLFIGPQLKYTTSGTGKYYCMPWENDKYALYIGNIGVGISGGVNIGYYF